MDKHLVHNSIGHDDNFISGLKIVHHSEETYIMAIIDDIVKFFKVKANRMIGELTYEFNLHGKGTITSVDIETYNNEVFILIVDSSHTLNLLNFGKKSICIKEDIYYACFALDTILCIDRDGERILILDSQKIDSQLAEHELEISEMKAVKLVNKQLIFIFYEECFNLDVFDFESNVSKNNLLDFDFKKRIKFEESFSPSDNMIDDESAIYWVYPIPKTNFIFTTGSFSESADIFYKTDKNIFAKASPEEQSLRMLAPSDSEGRICSFKGILYYPFKFGEDEPDTGKHKFTEEEIEIAFPRRIITISYSGRVDIFEGYFQDIKQYKNLTPLSLEEKKINIIKPQVILNPSAHILNEKEETKEQKVVESSGK